MTRTHKCKVEYLIKFISKGEKSDQNHLFDLEVLKKPKTDIVAFFDSVNMVETLVEYCSSGEDVSVNTVIILRN